MSLCGPVWTDIAAPALALPVLAYFGLAWEDMTSWGALRDVFLRAVQNPVVLLA
ncbi:phage holin, partial [Anaerotruncus colihominis]|uniref:phage holin n=1 Tax=Anaerotruncus colihominis TaxID=169435 RepID=UPI001FAD74F8